MIRVGGQILQPETIRNRYGNDSIKRVTVNRLISSDITYSYRTIEALDFELDSRAAIVRAAEKLNDSSFSFRVFKDSKCNPEFWERTQIGGFLIKPNVSPYKGIKDILKNSRLYGTECSTAIVIVFYLGLSEILPEELFNELFADLYLMNWKYLDKDLGVRSSNNIKDPLPGDCLYIANPDVDPATPEWQGENVIQLINGRYYGHGIGIRTIEGFIRALNQNRERGSTRSAYLTDTVVRPDYMYLYGRYSSALRTIASRKTLS
ncbi:MAG: protein-glutamine gamma-glutamyltransferase [Clostridiaceae bacterium]|jgi:protein-glutamine gamma-glutamyltransferase|nr:protein-glutamine gamma-glutamyltransferase [Clostridiaceae bacterium]